ncbi:hypothetical protein CYMTET_26825 [Cymbomonas tetramitiformis]|uniref:Uncharacterized protein n=1 Tax=Cymbomonas tetramitiformis TaxID=36881 RepID=A0AAE0KXL7_9CHLO|nr:hypothetical protein CYMTET_26825 [Cymbomonas tetramitiformis]
MEGDRIDVDEPPLRKKQYTKAIILRKFPLAFLLSMCFWVIVVCPTGPKEPAPRHLQGADENNVYEQLTRGGRDRLQYEGLFGVSLEQKGDIFDAPDTLGKHQREASLEEAKYDQLALAPHVQKNLSGTERARKPARATVHRKRAQSKESLERDVVTSPADRIEDALDALERLNAFPSPPSSLPSQPPEEPPPPILSHPTGFMRSQPYSVVHRPTYVVIEANVSKISAANRTYNRTPKHRSSGLDRVITRSKEESLNKMADTLGMDDLGLSYDFLKVMLNSYEGIQERTEGTNRSPGKLSPKEGMSNPPGRGERQEHQSRSKLAKGAMHLEPRSLLKAKVQLTKRPTRVNEHDLKSTVNDLLRNSFENEDGDTSLSMDEKAKLKLSLGLE